MMDAEEIVKVYETGKYSFRVIVRGEEISGIELYVLRTQQPWFGLGSDCHPVVDNQGRRYDLSNYIAQLDLTESKRERNKVLSSVRDILTKIAVTDYGVNPVLLVQSLSREQ